METSRLCFDQCSFECVDFHRWSQIIASLTRERIAEREAAVDNCQDLLEWVSTNCEEFREMKIVKDPRVISIGASTAPREKIIQRTRKINGTSKSLVERLVDFKIYALSVLGYMGSISAPDEATLKEEAHAPQCTTAGSCNAIPTHLSRAGSVCGLGIDLCGIRIISLAARFRTATCFGALANGLAKIRAARDYDGASIFALTPEWEEKFLRTSMAFSTMKACEYVHRIGRTGEIADSPEIKIQKAAMTLLCDTTLERNFAIPVAARASRILGPIGRHLMAQVIPMIRNAAQASRPGLAVGFLLV